MITKVFEVRDRGTFIPVMATAMKASNEEQGYLLRRAGYSFESDCVILCRLEAAGVDRNATYDPYAWGNRTMIAAHAYIEDNFAQLSDGDVIDVEFIAGETKEKKRSERYD